MRVDSTVWMDEDDIVQMSPHREFACLRIGGYLSLHPPRTGGEGVGCPLADLAVFDNLARRILAEVNRARVEIADQTATERAEIVEVAS